MSVRMSTWVWQHSDASGNDLLLLLALADVADDSGRCWPSVAHLAAKTRLSRATIQRRLHALTEAGQIVTKDRAGTSNVYEFRLDAEPSEVPQVATPEVPHPGEGSQIEAASPSEAGGASPTATGGASPGATRTINEPSLTRQKKSARKRATQVPEGWWPTDDMAKWARTIVSRTTDLKDLTEHFLDHHASKGSTFVDWNRAWQTWVRNSSKFGPARRPADTSVPAFWQEAQR